MEKIIVRIDGTEMTTGTGTELLGLVDRYSINYMDNPIAAAYVNGSIVSLREKLEGNAEIKTIRTISPEGKRIYRKSLCFLLCYASALIAPDRTETASSSATVMDISQIQKNSARQWKMPSGTIFRLTSLR